MCVWGGGGGGIRLTRYSTEAISLILSTSLLSRLTVGFNLRLHSTVYLQSAVFEILWVSCIHSVGLLSFLLASCGTKGKRDILKTCQTEMELNNSASKEKCKFICLRLHKRSWRCEIGAQSPVVFNRQFKINLKIPKKSRRVLGRLLNMY